MMGVNVDHIEEYCQARLSGDPLPPVNDQERAVCALILGETPGVEVGEWEHALADLYRRARRFVPLQPMPRHLHRVP